MLKVGVVVARFQVPALHAGHCAVIDAAAADNDRVIVLLGCSELDGKTAENPLLFTQREAIVRAYAYQPHILPLPNMQSHEAWSRALDLIVYSIYPQCDATIYVGRDSVVPSCYTGAANIHQVDLVGPSVAKRLSSDGLLPACRGTDVRAGIQLSNDGSFVRGQIFALNYQFPHAYQCVDIAVLANDSLSGGKGVLMIQRRDTGLWCLPGGFVDPTDDSLESAARRELFEETKLSCESGMKYVGSTLINDWRYRGQDKIMTALFGAVFSFGRPEITSEASDFGWLPLNDSAAWNYTEAGIVVAQHHRPLIDMLRNR